MLFRTLFTTYALMSTSLALFSLLFSSAEAQKNNIIGDEKKSTIIPRVGHFSYYYENYSVCETVIFIGVGTAMRADNYKKLSHDIISATGLSVVVVVVDDNPYHVKKQDPKKFAKIVNKIAGNIHKYIPICATAGVGSPDFIVGAHSASGEGAIKAIGQNRLDFEPIGFIGLAPYIVPKKDYKLKIPSLFWGFSKTSCCVAKFFASERAYTNANKIHRVFYQVHTDNRWNPINGGPHCVFADTGCPGWIPIIRRWGCAGTATEREQIPPAVGQSIDIFINSIKESGGNGFSSSKPFEECLIEGTKLYFNDQEVTGGIFSDF